MMYGIPMPLRKAALAVANLADADRAWLMARLEEHERARLAPVVGELQSLGLALEPGALRGLLEEEAPPVASPAAADRPLARAPVDAVFAALEREPDEVVALVLQARPWPWHEAVLLRFDDERRRRIDKSSRMPPVLRPRAVEALLRALEEALP